MKILYVISSLEDISGPPQVVRLLSTELARKGHRITVAYYFGHVNPIYKEEFTNKGIRIVKLSQRVNGLRRTDRTRLLFTLASKTREEGPDIIHAHSFDADFYSVIAGTLIRCKKIISIHSKSYYRWISRHIMRYKLFIVPLADRFICVSSNLQHIGINRFKSAQNKFCTINNAPAKEFFLRANKEERQKIRDQFGVSKGELLIGTVGNIAPAKGIEYFIRALGLIDSRKLRAVLVGRKDSVGRGLENDVVKMGLAKIVTFAGFMSNIPGFLDAIDIFVHPSIDEADPLSISEAMARGKKIIATDVGDISAKIINGETGILVPPGDPVSLAKAIDFCIQNPDRSEELGKNARTIAMRRYSLSEMVKKTLIVYDEVMRGRSEVTSLG